MPEQCILRWVRQRLCQFGRSSTSGSKPCYTRRRTAGRGRPGEGEEFAAAQQGVVGKEDHGDVGIGALLGLLRGFQSPSGLVVSGREGGGCDGFDLVSPQRFGLF